MWRSAVGQGIEKETETCPRGLFSHAERFENQRLHIAAMNSDRAAGYLDAIDNRVVGFGSKLTEQLRLAVNGAFQ